MKDKNLNFLLHPTPMEIADYINGKLDEDSTNLVETHLITCLSCRREVKDLRHEFAQIDKKVPELWAAFKQRAQKEGIRIPERKQVVEPNLRLAADQKTEAEQLEEIKRGFGPEFAAKGLRLPLSKETTYWGRLRIHRKDSVHFVLEKDRQRTADLDGATIEFYNKDTPEKTLTESVEKGFVLLDLSKLNLSIRNYKRVGLRLNFAGVSIEGSFAEMQ